MKHPASSGPWAVGSNGATVKVVDADGKAVCMLTPRRDQFNGDLIAAAPKLLKALQDMADAFGHYCEGDPSDDEVEAYREARVAIAKATGEAAA